MSNNADREAAFAGIQRRRRYTAKQWKAFVLEADQPGMTISYVACRHTPWMSAHIKEATLRAPID